MNCSTPGFPIHHHLLKFAQVHVHRIGYAIQPSHPLSPSSLRKVLELTRAKDPENLLLSTLEFYQQVGTLKSAQTEVLTHRKLANVDQQITAFGPSHHFLCTQTKTRNSHLGLVYFLDWCFKRDYRVQLRGETHHLGSSLPPTCVTFSIPCNLCASLFPSLGSK